MGELLPGSMGYTILLYSVSEPGGWRPEDIADDIPDCDPEQVHKAVGELEARGFIHRNSTDKRLWPLRPGRDAIQRQQL